MEQTLNIGLSIKIISDAITLTSFSEAEGEKFYESTKKNIQRMKNFDISSMTETDLSKYESFIKKIDSWSEWAKEKGYLQAYQQTAMTNFFLIMFEASHWNMPLDRNMAEHFFSYALAKVLYLFCKEYHERETPMEDKYNSLYLALANFDFFGCDDRYEKDISPIASSFDILTGLVKDMNKVIKFWEEKISDGGQRENPPNLRSYLSKWSKGVTPSWNIIKLLLDNDLCIPEEYFIDDEYIKKDGYRAFKANLFMAFILTNLFDSLERRDVITNETRSMLRNGVRMYYRDFYIRRDRDDKEFSSCFERDAKDNLMFRTLFCMIDGNLGVVPTLDYLNSSYCYPEIPIISDE